jgi:hypothetical protein
MKPNSDLQLKQSKKLFVYFTICFVFIHGFLVLNQSFFWDDWIWVLNPNEFRLALDELGVVFFKPQLHLLFQQPVSVIRFFVFICYFIGSAFFYKSLKKILVNDPWGAFLTSLVFVSLPYNIIGRSSLCTAPYAISFAFFYIGYFCFLKFRESGKKIFLVMSLVCSTLSFNTTSFLVLYVAVYLLTCLFDFKKNKSYYLYLAASGLLFFAHVVLFFVIKTMYFPTSGAYAAYNKVHFDIVSIIRLLTYDGSFAFFEPLFFSFLGKDIVTQNHRIIGAVAVIIFYFPTIWLYSKKMFLKAIWFTAAQIICFAALFPYTVVGKKPYVYNWDSRHQLLMSLGISLWFYLVLQLIPTAKIKNMIYAVLICVFTWGTVRMYLSTQGLRYQDLSLQNQLVAAIDIQSRGSYILLNRGSSPGMLSHDWNFYELTGMIYQSTGNHVNPVIIGSHLAGFSNPDLWLTEFQKYRNRYMVQDATWGQPYYCLRLTENVFMSEWTALEFLFDEYLGDQDEFKKKINGIYKIDKTKAEVLDQQQIRC